MENPIEIMKKEIERLEKALRIDEVVNVDNGVKDAIDSLKYAIRHLEANPTHLYTPKGTLVAMILNQDEYYQGIAVDVLHHNGYTENAVLIEYQKEEDSVYIYSWEQDTEDYVKKIKWNKD
jgi:hypothetical protein